MKWLALHIDTSPAGLEPVETMLSSLGIDGLMIEDEADFRRFLCGKFIWYPITGGRCGIYKLCYPRLPGAFHHIISPQNI